MSNVNYKLRLLLMMASLLCNVTSPCHLPASVLLSHARLWIGLLTALHIQLSHPSCHQLKMVVKCHLFTLDLDKAVSRISDGCHSCAAIRSSPTACIDQSTSPPPEAIRQSFAADVMKRSCQLIFILCETVSSYTSSLFLENEHHQTLRDALNRLFGNAPYGWSTCCDPN